MKYIKYLTTYNPAKVYGEFDFYILNKGNNSGKPLKEPCRNCFVFHAKNYVMYDYYYWLVYALWQTGAFKPYIGGSVIPFIHLEETNNLIVKTYSISRMREDEYSPACAGLIKLQKEREKVMNYLAHVERLKKTLLSNLLQ